MKIAHRLRRTTGTKSTWSMAHTMIRTTEVNSTYSMPPNNKTANVWEGVVQLSNQVQSLKRSCQCLPGSTAFIQHELNLRRNRNSQISVSFLLIHQSLKIILRYLSKFSIIPSAVSSQVAEYLSGVSVFFHSQCAPFSIAIAKLDLKI